MHVILGHPLHGARADIQSLIAIGLVVDPAAVPLEIGSQTPDRRAFSFAAQGLVKLIQSQKQHLRFGFPQHRLQGSGESFAGVGAFAVERFAGRPEVLCGVIPVENLHRLIGDGAQVVPDPGNAVAQQHALAGVLQTTAMRCGPGHGGKRFHLLPPA